MNTQQQRPLRIALTKGRIEDKTVELLRKIGTDCSAFDDKDRRLMLELPGSGLCAVLAKAPDVITYVEHGVCDLGVVGKDTIMEYGKSFYEVLDLGFGKCRFALAGPKGRSFYDGWQVRRVATKYPAVTRSFFNGKGVDVEIIKIEGSVELAPLLSLSDAIVDIVETGGTLRANGLEIYEEICPISARLIVNNAAMKMRKAEIEALLGKLETAVKEKLDVVR